MKNAWSTFWLVVASCMAVIVLYSILSPWMPWIVFMSIFGVVLFVSVFLYRKIKLRRRFF